MEHGFWHEVCRSRGMRDTHKAERDRYLLSRNQQWATGGRLPLAPRPRPDACEICEKVGGRRLSYDHDHKTGRFRGWICRQCNLGLGYFKDDIAILKFAIDYLYVAQKRREWDEHDPPAAIPLPPKRKPKRKAGTTNRTRRKPQYM